MQSSAALWGCLTPPWPAGVRGIVLRDPICRAYPMFHETINPTVKKTSNLQIWPKTKQRRTAMGRSIVAPSRRTDDKVGSAIRCRAEKCTNVRIKTCPCYVVADVTKHTTWRQNQHFKIKWIIYQLMKHGFSFSVFSFSLLSYWKYCVRKYIYRKGSQSYKLQWDPFLFTVHKKQLVAVMNTNNMHKQAAAVIIINYAMERNYTYYK